MNNLTDLNINDLSTVNSFRLWIKKNLKHLYLNKDIPTSHMLIYLEYIRNLIFKLDSIDKSFWVKQIRDLENDISSIKNMEG